MQYKYPFVKPVFPDSTEIAKDFTEIVASNWYTNFGPFEQRFRGEISRFLSEDGVYVCTTANATLSLDIACRALFGSSDKTQVLMPSFTFASGASVLLSIGLEPVFIDVDEDWQPSLLQAKKYVSQNREKVAGILLCNTFGVGNTSIREWESFASKVGIPLVIDSAAGFGSTYSDNELLGSRGDCEIFSLHATKPFAVGEGGLITSRNQVLIDLCRRMTNFGFNDERVVDALGTNAKLQEINCAIGIRQLRVLSDRVGQRQKLLAGYVSLLGSKGYEFQVNGERSTVAFVSVLAPTAAIAQQSIHALVGAGVEAKQYYTPLHTQPLFDALPQLPLTKTVDIYERIISLPLHDQMSIKDIKFITNLML